MSPSLQDAAALHRQGRLKEAEAAYRALVAAAPRDAQALHLLGLLYLGQGRRQEALEAFNRSVQADPASPVGHFHLGSVLSAMGRHDEALAQFDAALRLAPGLGEAHFARGNVLYRTGRIADAAAAFAEAVRLNPENVQAQLHLGSALKDLKREDEALRVCDEALVQAPGHADAHYLQGSLLFAAKREEAALKAFEQSAALAPKMAEAYFGMTGALLALGRYGEALAAADKALALAPDSALAHNNRGAALRKLARFEEAKAEFDRTIALEPRLAEAYYNRSGPLYELGRLEDALADTEQALALQPEYSEAASFRFCLASHLCDWRYRSERLAKLEAYGRERREIEVFAFLHALDDPELHLIAAREAAPRPKHISVLPALHAHERLRIAYLSPDFGNHPVAHQIAPLIESHDRTRFEVFGVSLFASPPSPMRERLKKGFEHFVEADGLSDVALTQKLADLEIDIAVDLAGYTDKGRPQLFAHKPAPLCVAYLGYPGTFGADYMDYLIADSCVAPDGAERYYVEKLVRLSGCFMPYDMPPDAPSPSRAAERLPEDGFVFANFNKSDKLSPEMFSIWMRLLVAVPGSVLWLAPNNATVRANLQKEAETLGVSAARLVFAERLPARADHLARLALADLFLDTLPYNAHATASDFLGAGVPVLTCIGKSFAARVAASMLQTAGVEELITQDLAAYESAALALARAPERLAPLREQIKKSRSREETVRLCRRIETAFDIMWDRHRRGLKPDNIEVP